MPVPSAWTGSLLEWAKAVAGWKLIPVPRSLKGRLAAWLNLQRGGQVEARARSHHRLAVGMRLGEGRRKVDAGAGRTRGADGGDGDRFLVRGGADGDLVAHSETVHVADFDIGRAGARIRREIRAVRLRADAA